MRGIAILLAVVAPVAAAGQQQPQTRPDNLPPGAVVQPLDDTGPGADLRRHLTTLAQNPQSLEALIGAGRAALDMGDGQASITFFARADELAPRDARVKAGMASAFVQLEQPQAALALFGEAISLGAPEAAIAGDRGLAYDMVGEPARAQQDYALALRRNDDPELQRRMAVSLAIAGRREDALRVIDAQLRRNDRAAWRTQAFVLALTGDTAGANRTAQNVMPAGSAAAMAPFFARLAGLTSAQKALAAHFGHIPSEGGPVQVAANSEGLATTPGLAPERNDRTETAADAPRRRPEATASQVERAAVRRRAPVRIARNDPRPNRASPDPPRQTVQAQAEPQVAQPAMTPSVVTAPVTPPAESASQPTADEPPSVVADTPAQANAAVPPPTAIELPPSAVANSDSAPIGFSLSPQGVQPGAAPHGQPEPVPTPATPPPAPDRAVLADIAEVVNSLPVEEPVRSTNSPPVTRRPAETPSLSRTAAATPAREAPRRNQRQRAAPPPHPSRHWVQVAGGASRGTLPREYTRLRDLAPALLRSRSPYVVATRTSNRLLVGPFASSAAAQEFVNQLARRNVAAFAWTSEAGQEIERLQIGR